MKTQGVVEEDRNISFGAKTDVKGGGEVKRKLRLTVWSKEKVRTKEECINDKRK